MEQKVVFREERYLLGIYFNIKLLFIVMPESSCSLNSRGRAVNEYLEIKSFCVTDHEIAIIDNYNHFLRSMMLKQDVS